MSRQLRELERIESRVLAALRFIDAGTGADIDTPMQAHALDGAARLLRNRSGLLVVSEWAALREHRDAFSAPPAAPDIGSLTLRIAVDDPSGRYLPRTVAVPLPRDPDPANQAESDSLFRPLEVPMYPSAAGVTGGNWSLLRVSLTEQGSGDLLGGALLRVHRNGDVIACGMSDWRGEALVAVIGVPVMTFGDDEDAVVVDEISVQLEAVFDPDAGLRTPASALDAPHRPGAPLRVDPAALDAAADDLPSATTTLAIAARRSQRVALEVALQ